MSEQSTGSGLNVFAVLDSLQEAVAESKPLPWPMQTHSMIDKDKFIRLIERTRETLPQEVHQARWVSRETERIAHESTSRADQVVKEAQSKAEEMVREAEAETKRKISESEIVTTARSEAETLVKEAREKAEQILAQAEGEAEKLKKSAESFARQTREDADRYAMRVLGGMESELSKILSIVKQGQESLHDSQG